MRSCLLEYSCLDIHLMNICADRSMEVKLPPNPFRKLRRTDQPTNRPIYRQTDRLKGKFHLQLGRDKFKEMDYFFKKKVYFFDNIPALVWRFSSRCTAIDYYVRPYETFCFGSQGCRSVGLKLLM